ncbi:MAG: type III pantothenate kinase, partial [Thermodesulfobacteriota bacterium]
MGNTDTVLGLFEDNTLTGHWRFATSAQGSAEELFTLISGLFTSEGVRAEDITGAVACSVVPGVDEAVRGAISRLTGKDLCFVGVDILPPIPVITEDPAEVGSDRIVNAVAAHAIFKGAAIIVDFGTAITVDLVTDKGEYAGGAIAPGVGISAEALFARASLLPR